MANVALRPLGWLRWRNLGLAGAAALCVAGVALLALGWLWWRAWVWRAPRQFHTQFDLTQTFYGQFFHTQYTNTRNIVTHNLEKHAIFPFTQRCHTHTRTPLSHTTFTHTHKYTHKFPHTCLSRTHLHTQLFYHLLSFSCISHPMVTVVLCFLEIV